MSNTHGGAREGAGRPRGSLKPEGRRKQRQVTAYDDEWEAIKRFARILKHGDKAACLKFIERQEAKVGKD